MARTEAVGGAARRDRRYCVDWSDSAYPKIVYTKGHPYPEDGVRFDEAKAQIIEHFAGLRMHANAMIARYRSMRISDVSPE